MDFLSYTSTFNQFYKILLDRKNEMSALISLLDGIKKCDTYKKQAALRFGFVGINSQYEGGIKECFEYFLIQIFSQVNEDGNRLKETFYYNKLSSFNSGKTINNIPVGKIKCLIQSMGMSYEDFLTIVQKDLFEKRFFAHRIKLLGLEKKFYIRNPTTLVVDPELSLKNIIDSILIEYRNQIAHGTLIIIDENLLLGLREFVIIFLEVLISFIVDNLIEKSFYK